MKQEKFPQQGSQGSWGSWEKYFRSESLRWSYMQLGCCRASISGLTNDICVFNKQDESKQNALIQTTWVLAHFPLSSHEVGDAPPCLSKKHEFHTSESPNLPVTHLQFEKLKVRACIYDVTDWSMIPHQALLHHLSWAWASRVPCWSCGMMQQWKAYTEKSTIKRAYSVIGG